jgi:hypothetical protein
MVNIVLLDRGKFLWRFRADRKKDFALVLTRFIYECTQQINSVIHFWVSFPRNDALLGSILPPFRPALVTVFASLKRNLQWYSIRVQTQAMFQPLKFSVTSHSASVNTKMVPLYEPQPFLLYFTALTHPVSSFAVSVSSCDSVVKLSR